MNPEDIVGQQHQQRMSMNVNPDDLPDIMCTCGSHLWEQGIRLKKISGLISQTGKDQIATIPIIMCKKCSRELAEVMEELDKESPIVQA